MKEIVIIGAGFCGLAAAWYLSQGQQPARIQIFDPEPIGTTTSGLAAGLLHPFAGAHAKRNPRASEGIAASLELFAVAEKALGYPIVTASGILRLALSEEQKTDFSLCQKKYAQEVHWLTDAQCQKKVSGITRLRASF